MHNNYLDQSALTRESGIEELLDQISKLSPEKKALLIKHLLGQEGDKEDSSGVHVILGNGHNYSWHAGMVVQISSGNEELMQQIVSALATRIERGDLKPNP